MSKISAAAPLLRLVTPNALGEAELPARPAMSDQEFKQMTGVMARWADALCRRSESLAALGEIWLGKRA